MELLELPPTTESRTEPTPTTAPTSLVQELAPSQALITEMRLFREELVAARMQMQLLNGTMSKIAARMDVCESRMSGIDERLDALERRFETSTSPSNSDNSILKAMEHLKSELNEREQDN